MKSITKTIALLTICALSVCADQLMAQPNVRKYVAGKDNSYGIVYSLPKTEIEAVILVETISFTPGPLCLYSRRYLGVDARSEASTTYHIRQADLRTLGVADKDNTYVVEFRPGTVAPYVYLDREGIICSINAGRVPEEPKPSKAEQARYPFTSAASSSSSPPPALPQEYALANSVGKQAEIAAAYLYNIRESIVDLMKGSVENMPKDGAAMQLMLEGLRAEEAATLALFAGRTETSQFDYRAKLTPQGEINDRVLFRFSDVFGPMPADDLAGAPVLLSLKITENKAPVTEEEIKRQERRLHKGGLVYNVPGKAEVSLQLNGRTLLRTTLPIAQFGSKETLISRLFKPKGEDSVQIYFDPSTGGISHIVGLEK